MWDVADDLSDRVWLMPEVEAVEKVRLLFELYREMPAYWVVHRIEWLAKDLKGDDWEAVWQGFREVLSQESPELADPASYALWCGFFEDEHVAPKAWQALSTQAAPDILTKRLLSVSGPVPWAAKVETYRRLAKDRRWHRDLAEALWFCYGDVYGKTDVREARTLLSTLQLAPNTLEAENAATLKADFALGYSNYAEKLGFPGGTGATAPGPGARVWRRIKRFFSEGGQDHGA